MQTTKTKTKHDDYKKLLITPFLTKHWHHCTALLTADSSSKRRNGHIVLICELHLSLCYWIILPIVAFFPCEN